MAKKEFTVKEYSKQIFPLCSAGCTAVVIANFVQFMVKEAYQNMAYIAAYGLVGLIAIAIFVVRNKYSNEFCKKHKAYAVAAGAAALIMAAVRVMRPQFLTGQRQSLAGNPIDTGVLATFILIALTGKPMLDILDTMRYVQPTPTHLLPKEEE